MDYLSNVQEIRKLAIMALFSDDDFMNTFVLKGGNALDIAYKISSRASVDVDVSMESDFKEDEIENVKEKLEKLLVETFKEKGYHLFDYKFIKKPLNIRDEVKDFWGGYCIEFKVIKTDDFIKLGKDIDSIRRNATVIGENQKKTFSIDISKFEYCSHKEEKEIEDLTIYVYTPLMVIYEKLRAICQQMEEYKSIVPTNQRPRAKDFFDIYVILENLTTLDDFMKPSNQKMLKEIFKIKRVPINFLDKIKDQREFHRNSFDAIRDTVYSYFKLESYDYYFDYVVEKVQLLETLWKE